jgi:RecA-family ATPase
MTGEGLDKVREVMAAPEDIDMGDVPPAAPERAARRRLSARAQKLLAAVEFGHEIKPELNRPYLVKGLLDRGALSLLYGAPGSAKTFAAIDLAHHVFEGATWAGCRVAQANALYIACEGGVMFANRMAARKARFAVLRAPVTLSGQNSDAPPLADMVLHLAATHGVGFGLIIADTLARTMAGADENAGADMVQLVRNVDHLREVTGAHVMLIHHSGKDAAKGARGHSSILGAVDTEMQITCDRETKRRMLTVTKQRDGEDGIEFPFRLKRIDLGRDSDGDPVYSCTLDHEEGATPQLF